MATVSENLEMLKRQHNYLFNAVHSYIPETTSNMSIGQLTGYISNIRSDAYSEALEKAYSSVVGEKSAFNNETLTITDITPTKHAMGISISQANRIPYPYVDTTKTVDGITFTDNGNTVGVSGTSSDSVFFDFTVLENFPQGNYTFDCIYNWQGQAQPAVDTFVRLHITYINNDSASQYYGEEATFTLSIYWNSSGTTTLTPHPISIGENSMLKIRAECKGEFQNFYMFPTLVEGTLTSLSADMYTQNVDLSNCSLNVIGGKSLIQYPYYNLPQGSSKVYQGITYTDNGDGTITCNGTCTGNGAFYFANIFDPQISGIKYVLTGTADGSDSSTYYLRTNSNKRDYGSGTVYKPSSNDTLGIYVRKGQVFDNVIFKPQIEEGAQLTDATEFEPRVVYQYISDENGVFSDVMSLYPRISMSTNALGTRLKCRYYRDIEEVILSSVSEQAVAMAMSGGD